MSKIVIIEKDMFAREALERILAERQLDAHCLVVESAASVGAHDGACLWIKGKQDAPLVGLSLKESDQFEKPLRIGALLDRVTRYIAAGQDCGALHILTIGVYELDCQNNALTHGETGDVIRLTDKETHILRFLSGKDGAVVDRQMLLDEVWGYAQNVETHTLETHIYRLRQKIEDDPANPALLVTSEQGYRLEV